MTVTVFSTTTCPYCKMLKDYLSQKNIAFEAIDVSVDHARGKEMIQKSGQMGVPVVIINKDDGKEEIVIGFDKARITKLLGIKD